MVLQLKKGDKIYLLTKNLKTRQKSNKIDLIKIKPFFIKAKKRTITYKLKLHKNVIVYLIFYILLLELADSKIPMKDKFYYQAQEKNKFNIKKIWIKKIIIIFISEKNTLYQKTYKKYLKT